MRCPKCDSENSDSAKFCKKCGTPLKKKEFNHQKMIDSMNDSSRSDNTTKYIIIALIAIALVLAGAFIYISAFGHGQGDNSQNSVQNSADIQESDEPAQAQSSQATPDVEEMSILGGSFSTGGELEDKTYASINVGSEHAGEKVTVQIFYSRDGSSLNNGNMVPVTVSSEGYVDVASADAYKYFPDHAEINLFDDSGNLLDTQSVDLSPQAGTQTF